MRLDAFIVDLLYEHDCVIVPGFGGLVANYRPARLNQRTHVIAPPSKHIGFNRNLVSNDGLLVHHMAGIMNVPYKDALAKMNLAVEECHRALLNEGRVVWEKIGIFFKDKSGQVQFIPEDQENFLLSSFGLAPVQLKYIEQAAPVETPVISIEKARRSAAGGWKMAAAIALPLLVGGSLLLRNELNSGRLNMASLNPFDTAQVIADYKVRQDESTIVLDSIPRAEVAEPVITKPAETPSPVVESTPAPATRPDPAGDKEPKPLAKGRYAVIGGAFKVRENAERFREKLRAEGFNASFAGKKDGMTLVAYGIYDSAAEAQTAMENLRSTDGVNAWIRRH